MCGDVGSGDLRCNGVGYDDDLFSQMIFKPKLQLRRLS